MHEISRLLTTLADPLYVKTECYYVSKAFHGLHGQNMWCHGALSMDATCNNGNVLLLTKNYNIINVWLQPYHHLLSL